MPPSRADDPARRSLVPPRAANSLTLAAVWTGAGTALVAAVAAIASVALLWLPAAGADGNARSAIRAGLLTFLAALHGGVTVDGLSSAFVPFGLTLLVVALAWRAGSGLADVAADLDDAAPARLLRVLGLQTLAFAVVCVVLGHFATLGTSSVPMAGVAVAAVVLFGVSSGCALVRWSPLREAFAAQRPPGVAAALRAGLAVSTVYLLGGALLAASSLALHHVRVEQLSHQIGGGFAGVPILALGALTAPNAAVAGAGYLAGPGFAVGSGSEVSLWSGAHGTVPSFPILGALPSGPAGAAAWALAVLTLVVAGACAARAVAAEAGWRAWGLRLAGAAVTAGLLAMFFSWQTGGAIGSGGLAAVGVSPWQAGFALAVVTFGAGGACLAAVAVTRILRGLRTPAPIRALADRASAVAERASGSLIATHSVVDRDEAVGGGLRATLRSVAAAVTITEEERQTAASTQITAPIPRVDAEAEEPADRQAG